MFASRLEAIAVRLEAIVGRLEAIAISLCLLMSSISETPFGLKLQARQAT